VQAGELTDGKRSLKAFVELLIGTGFRIPAGEERFQTHECSSSLKLEFSQAAKTTQDLNQIFVRTSLGAVRFSTNSVPRNFLNPSLARLTGTPLFSAQMRSSAGTEGEQQLKSSSSES
jgi:hypothetical protein